MDVADGGIEAINARRASSQGTRIILADFVEDSQIGEFLGNNCVLFQEAGREISRETRGGNARHAETRINQSGFNDLARDRRGI